MEDFVDKKNQVHINRIKVQCLKKEWGVVMLRQYLSYGLSHVSKCKNIK